jgi:hypothetical protein
MLWECVGGERQTASEPLGSGKEGEFEGAHRRHLNHEADPSTTHVQLVSRGIPVDPLVGFPPGEESVCAWGFPGREKG